GGGRSRLVSLGRCGHGRRDSPVLAVVEAVRTAQSGPENPHRRRSGPVVLQGVPDGHRRDFYIFGVSPGDGGRIGRLRPFRMSGRRGGGGIPPGIPPYTRNTDGWGGCVVRDRLSVIPAGQGSGSRMPPVELPG